MSGTGQELGRREEGPFFDVTTFQQISPANLHLLEIAFDLGKADEATPNAWSFVQMMLETSLFFYPSDSLLKSLRELAVEVEEGDDGPLYPYEFQVTPTDWDPLDEQPSPQITVFCLAGEDTCDRAWLLARLQTLLATFAQTHGEASAAQFQTLINVGNETLKWRPDRVTRNQRSHGAKIRLAVPSLCS
ncbi:MAG: hypothetical protein R2932_49935 [Caldilineaceae bacterium]